MSLAQKATILRFPISAPTDVLAAGADIVLADQSANPAFYVDPEAIPANAGFNGLYVDLRDNVLVEAVRLVSPFADALVIDLGTLPALRDGIVVELFGFRGTFNFTPISGARAYQSFNFKNPLGEWLTVNKFLEWTDCTNPTAKTWKQVGIIPQGITIHTKGVDSIWDGHPIDLALEVMLRHNYGSAL